MNMFTVLPVGGGAYTNVEIILTTGKSFTVQDESGTILLRYAYGSGKLEVKQEMVQHLGITNCEIKVIV